MLDLRLDRVESRVSFSGDFSFSNQIKERQLDLPFDASVAAQEQVFKGRLLGGI